MPSPLFQPALLPSILAIKEPAITERNIKTYDLSWNGIQIKISHEADCRRSAHDLQAKFFHETITRRTLSHLTSRAVPICERPYRMSSAYRRWTKWIGSSSKGILAGIAIRSLNYETQVVALAKSFRRNNPGRRGNISVPQLSLAIEDHLRVDTAPIVEPNKMIVPIAVVGGLLPVAPNSVAPPKMRKPSLAAR